MFSCPDCGRDFKGYQGVSVHWRRTHGKHTEVLWGILFNDGVVPTCACGCGQVPAYRGKEGFNKYVSGHNQRVSCNFKMHDNTGKKPWNFGLTASLDDRIEALAQKMSQTRREKGIGKGAKNSNWKGGISNINVRLRNNIELYETWKLPILKRDAFKCQHCGATEHLHVHHDDVMFHEIRDALIEKYFGRRASLITLSEHQIEMLRNAIVEYHSENGVSGITLCQSCHAAAHCSA